MKLTEFCADANRIAVNECMRMNANRVILLPRALHLCLFLVFHFTSLSRISFIEVDVVAIAIA